MSESEIDGFAHRQRRFLALGAIPLLGSVAIPSRAQKIVEAGPDRVFVETASSLMSAGCSG
jgi:hypothetical protein